MSRKAMSRDEVLRIEKLLIEGKNHPEVAKIVKRSRVMVGIIYRGEHKLSSSYRIRTPIVGYVRCKGCGCILLEAPCLTCLMRNREKF